MKASLAAGRPTHRLSRIVAQVGLVAGMLAITTDAAMADDPATSRTLTYHLMDCSGPLGTPPSFDAVKQPGGAAGLHVVDGRGIFIAMEALDVATGTVLFTTPGFDDNNVATVTCEVIHPVTNDLQQVTGILTPIG